MPRISILADAEFIEALSAEKDLPITNQERTTGTQTETDRLGFELGSVEALIGYIAAGVEAIVIARHFISAFRRSKRARLEITSPKGRVSIELEGKSEDAVATLIRAALPFTQ